MPAAAVADCFKVIARDREHWQSALGWRSQCASQQSRQLASPSLSRRRLGHFLKLIVFVGRRRRRHSGAVIRPEAQVWPPQTDVRPKLPLADGDWCIHTAIANLRLSIRRQGAYHVIMSNQSSPDVDFNCRHCGARYVVSYTELPIADSGSVYCECCKRRMVQWNSALQPRYKLVERPDRKYP
jgi:hypothetical protein